MTENDSRKDKKVSYGNPSDSIINLEENEEGVCSDHLRNYINKVLKENAITSYKLSGLLGCSETVVRNFLIGGSSKIRSPALVNLADYTKVSLDKLVGRNLEFSKEIKSEVIIGFNANDKELVMSIKKQSQKYNHDEEFNKENNKFASLNKRRQKKIKAPAGEEIENKKIKKLK